MRGVKPAQAGVALALALWLLTLLSLLAAGYGYAMRTETKLTIHGVELAEARAIAEAGVWLAVNELLKPPPKRQWLTDGTGYRLDFGAGRIRLRIQDEAGRIDLNTANDALLRALVERAAEPGADMGFVFSAIQDWRDPDKHRRYADAEDRDYAHAGYGAKDAPFNSIEELRLVAGMTNEIFARMYPALTLFSGQPGIHPLVTPRQVLLALPGGYEEQVDTFLLERRGRNGNVSPPPGMDNRFFGGATGTAFNITSEGMAGRGRLTLDVVVTLNNDARLPYSILSWRESKPVYTDKQDENASLKPVPDGRQSTT